MTERLAKISKIQQQAMRVGQKRPRTPQPAVNKGSIDLTSDDPVAKKATISPQGKNNALLFGAPKV